MRITIAPTGDEEIIREYGYRTASISEPSDDLTRDEVEGLFDALLLAYGYAPAMDDDDCDCHCGGRKQ